MSQLVTCCPHCSTSFHVNEQQLRAARGAVRCGSCLQVFRADENIVFNEDEPRQVTSKAIEDLLDDDDFLIHDDIELEGDEDDAAATKKAAGNKPDTSQPYAQPPQPKEKPLIDDAFGEQQWQDIDNSADDQQTDDINDLEDKSRDDDPWGDNQQHAVTPEWDPEPEELHPLEQQLEQRLARLNKDRTRPDPSDRASPPAIGEEPLLVAQHRDQLISAIEPAPLEVNWRPQRHRRVPGWLWTLLALLLLALIAAQAAYFRFDSLSKREPWRQLYAAVCPLIGCTLPPLVDLGAIRTSNLVVRSHPQIAGALVVEAVLLNKAPFAQPFPSLQLSFTDLKNTPVASRRFTPRDYLHGELAGRTQMPVGNPVHIAIDIVDPGTKAVNYELLIAR